MERVLRATTTTTTTTMDGSERRTISRWFQRSSWSSSNDELDSEYNDEYDENTRSLAFRTSSLVHHDPTNNFQYDCDFYYYSIDNVFFFKCLEQTFYIFHKHETSEHDLEQSSNDDFDEQALMESSDRFFNKYDQGTSFKTNNIDTYLEFCYDYYDYVSIKSASTSEYEYENEFEF